MTDPVPQTADAVDETGLLLRDAGGFMLRLDHGAVKRLVLRRVPVDLVEKRVRVRGQYLGDDVIEADGVAQG